MQYGTSSAAMRSTVAAAPRPVDIELPIKFVECPLREMRRRVIQATQFNRLRNHDVADEADRVEKRCQEDEIRRRGRIQPL